MQDGDINFIERDNNNVIAYRRTLNENELIVICNFRGEEIFLKERTLSEYSAEYKKILGNYDGVEKNLRPYEVIVFGK